MSYQIRPGDTLSHLAQRFGTTVQSLAQTNGIQNPDLIYAGAQLRVPGGAAESGSPTPGSPQAIQAGLQQDRYDGPSGAQGGAAAGSVSGSARAQMDALMRTAAAGAGGKRPGGYCLKAVQDYLAQTRYGNAGSIPRLPYARNFAEYLNQGNNAQKHGLKRLNISNPYDAPPGAIIVVRPGTPGTAHPTAGDIVVKGPGDAFYNDGNMGYGGRQNFPPGNSYVLGVYVPA